MAANPEHTQTPAEVKERCDRFRDTFARLRAEIAKVMVGQEEVVGSVLTALFAGGHVLLEGVPGLGKTLLVRTLATTLHLPFSRIQFTPDLMPSDVIGTNIINEDEHGHRAFSFQKGPIFAQVVLADEINRATPKTQSALLEAMQERSVTVGGVTRRLDDPFIVLATQNPIEQEGTYPLPEAQLDRFLIKVRVDYPSRQDERQILELGLNGRAPQASVVASRESLAEAVRAVQEVTIDDVLKDYIVQLVYATRRPAAYRLPALEPLIAFGASPRASIALAQAARAHAFLQGRAYTTPDDVKALAHDVLRHRIVTTYEAEAEELTTDDLIDRVLDGVDVP
jgi:MoxR-like ATPase